MLHRPVLGLLVVLASAVADAAPLLSQTTYLCSVGLDCLAPETTGGPALVDPDAFEGSNTTTPLAPGASVADLHSGGGLSSSATATAVGLAPPQLRLRIEDTVLADDQAVIAHLYWEDTLTIDRSVAAGTPTTWTPMLDYSGIMELFAESPAGGGVEWSFNIAVNTNTVIAAGGFCTPGSTPTGDVDCSGNTGFGPGFPSAVTVLDEVPFLVQAGAVLRIGGPNITGLLDMEIDWLGVVVGDAGGTPVDDFTLSSESGVDWTLVSVPEPSAGLLVSLGLAGLAALRRR